MRLAILLTLAALPALAAPGHEVRAIAMDHRDGPVTVHLWYPAADPDAEAEPLGRNAMFAGTEVISDAPPAPGEHPVILLSHGSGGSADKMGWLAGPLAEDGWIVAAPNHPGTTSRDSLPERTIMPWERTADMRAVLDMLEGDSPVPADGAGAVAIGYSLGGHTALRLGGARASKSAFLDYCERNAGELDCGWFEENGLDLGTIDAERYEAADADPRIRAVVAIDPALSAAYIDESLAAMDLPVLTLGLGAAGAVPEGVDAAPVAARIPGARHEQIPGAVHFSALGACRRLGRIVIGLLEDEPICADPDRPRSAVQADILAAVQAFLSQHP